MDENQLKTIDEFSHALAGLLHRCDLDKPDVAAGLVAAAVILAASDGFEPDEQGEIIARFADNAIARLDCLCEPEEVRH